MACSSETALCGVLLLAVGLAALTMAEGRDHLVGGKPDAWKIPSSSSSSSPSQPSALTRWASNSRFQVGDNLVWKYDAQKDSVLEVTRDAYLACNTTKPIAEHKEGETKVHLDHSGPYYFISGAEGHCDKGEKMIVVVMAPRNRHGGGSPAPAPSPGAYGVESPAVAPTSAAATGGLKAGLVVLVVGFVVGVVVGV